jgi:ABC-2 type transport system permease protein
VLPTAWSAIGAVPALDGAAGWLDQGRTMTPMLEEPLSAGQWARVATSCALWTALPVLLGAWRVTRNDVR